MIMITPKGIQRMITPKGIQRMITPKGIQTRNYCSTHTSPISG